jgi:hypothetical protein
MISLIILVKTFPRLASAAPFFLLIVLHFECPDISHPNVESGSQKRKLQHHIILTLQKQEFSLLHSNPSVTGVFIPLWQRGIKGDFKIMLRKSPFAPLFQREV